MKRVDQCSVELKHRLAARDHHQPVLLASAPQIVNMRRKLIGAAELAAAFAVRADEIGIAEAALRFARSCSRPDHRLHPAKRRNTARLPACTPSPCKRQEHSLTA